jgi:peptidoglycan-associated lipoprotein
MKHLSFAVLAVAAGLYGCATTESQDTGASTTGAATSSGSQSGAQTGKAQPPTRMGQGSGSGTGTGMGGSQQPDLKRSVFYEFDKYEIKPEYRTLVESHARWLKSNPKAKLTVEGNADEQGSREYNLALGQRRAESVTKMLVLMGAKPEQIEAVSFGEERPRTNGHDEKAWSENRRSDFASR